MKRINKIIIGIFILVMLSSIKVIAHGGNISGWKDKKSSKITQYNGEYYGYHKQNGARHYHQVEWNEENQKWEIIKTAVYYDGNFNIINTIDNSNKEKIEVKYIESIDGDTAKFELNGEVIIVRFLGIDTPETVHPTKGEEAYGKEASNYTKKKLENSNKIELDYDENASKTDKYGRHLAWIWIDDALLQEELISNGLAKTYMLQDNYKYAWILQEKEEKAKEEKIGIWREELKAQENVIIENVDNKDANGYFIGLLIIVISLISTILFGKIKPKKKKR